MERIALFYSGGTLYWSSIIITLAATAAICGFLWLYLRESGNITAGFSAVATALVLSLLFARLVHYYAFTEAYPNLFTALTDYSTGGFALIGAFAGCLAAAKLTHAVGLHKDIPEMLDCMCLGGGAAIAVGRLSAFYNLSDRGQIVSASPAMPWVTTVVNTVSGTTEHRLATFLLQAFITGTITIALMIFYRKRPRSYRNGDTALLFLLCYCAAQVILDSTRYDAISFHSNGFISIVQVTSVLTVIFIIALLSLRMVKHHGLIVWNLLMWSGMLLLLAITGYMEYHVQRHGNHALFAYTVMTLCMSGLVALAVFIYRHSQKPDQRKHSHKEVHYGTRM